jgi:uncharacterized membrane protein
MMWIHVVAGTIGLIAAVFALSSTKGKNLHRKSGMIYVIAMLLMSLSGAIVAYFTPKPISVIAGMLVFYLVSTGLITTRYSVQTTRWLTSSLMVLACVIGYYGIQYGLIAYHSPSGQLDGLPYPPYFVFGTVAFSAALLDIRLLIAKEIRGAHRIARHLWRMCFALFMACAAFFLGQMNQFPEAFQILPLLALPVLISILVIPYWLFRTLRTKRTKSDQ